MKIHKYELKITESQKISISGCYASILSVAEQNGKLMTWVIVDEQIKHGARPSIYVEIVGTGHSPPSQRRFIGTVVMSDGFVWHVFADTEYEEDRL